MKSFKKILSLFIILTMSTGLISLSACGKVDIQTISVGDFTSLVVDKFGIETYQSEEPHVASVGTDSAYFTAVQGAYEWNIIEDEDDYNVSSNLSKEYCALMLTRAINASETEGKTNEEVTQMAKDKGYITYDYRGRKDGKRAVSADEAKASLDAAFSFYANPGYSEPIEEVTYKDDVVVVGQEEGYTWDGSSFVFNPDSGESALPAGDSDAQAAENGGAEAEPASGKSDSGKSSSDKSSSGKSSSSKSAASVGKIFYPSENTVAIPEEVAKNIKPGTTYVVPSGEGTLMAYKAEKVEYQDGYAIIDNSASGASFEETVQELHIDQMGQKPDLTAGTVRDGLGNIIISGPQAEGMLKIDGASTEFLGTNRTSNCGNDGKISLTVDGWTISGSVTSSKVSFKVSGSPFEGAKVSKEYEISNVSFDAYVDWGLFSGFKEIKAILHYDTKDTCHGEFNYDKQYNLAPQYTNGNGKFLTNVKRSVLKDSKDKGAKSIKICSIPLVSAFGAASINLDVKILISISGEITLTVTTSNAKGVQYTKGSGFRFVSDEKKDTKLDIKAKLEATLYLGIEVRFLAWNLVGAGIQGGIGVEAEVKVHLVDEMKRELDVIAMGDQDGKECEAVFGSLDGVKYNHTFYGELTLHTEICVDITTYWLLKITMDPDCELCKLIKQTPSKEFFNKENGKIKELSGHWEDGKNVGKCTRQYEAGPEEETTESETIMDSKGTLSLDKRFISLGAGESETVSVVKFPEGYDASKITFSSSNDKVVKVDSSGRITAVDSGTAGVRVETTDGKYKAACVVLVASKKAEFQTLPDRTKKSA